MVLGEREGVRKGGAWRAEKSGPAGTISFFFLFFFLSRQLKREKRKQIQKCSFVSRRAFVKKTNGKIKETNN